MKRYQTWLGLFAAMFVIWQCTVYASEKLNISIANWAFERLAAQNLNIELALTAKGLAVTASADSITLPEGIGRVSKVKFYCDELLVFSEQWSCSRGKLSFIHKQTGQQYLTFKAKVIKPEHEYYQFDVSGLKLADANLAISATYDSHAWKATVTTPQASLKSVLQLVSPYLNAANVALLADWSIDSNIIISANLKGYDNRIDKVDVELTSTAFNLSDSQGKYVTEDITADIALKLDMSKQAWLWQTAIKLKAGQGYGEPIFVDFGETPLSLEAEGQWQPKEGLLVVSQAELKHGSIMQAQGSFTGSLEQINMLEVTVEQADLANLYAVWLQPFFTGTAAAKLELAGNVGLKFQQQASAYQLSINMDDVYIDDEAKRFGLYGLTGQIGWTNDVQLMPSQLQWQSGYLYAVPMGKSELIAVANESQLKLLSPWILPILDGELRINEFELQRPDQERTQWTFEGLLTPISMESLSGALGWPLLHGKLSGVIPKVTYIDQQIQVDGALLVKLFDGTTVIRDLRLNKPFGSLPQLYANIDLTGLDLETLTRTFDFGKITGKLDGRVSKLRLSNWQPVQFDASFATPEGDKSRRRISQRAVDNLSQIGGGVGGVLSRSFLRFFEDFSYQRLGLNCKLRNDVCEMSGVAEAEQGYYIVKGGGLPPRINVVGYTRQVDWPDLIDRLNAVSHSSGPVVQ